MSDSGNPFLSQPLGFGSYRYRLDPGACLDRFHIREFIGSGSFGDVYLADDKVADRDVAIKVVDVGPCSSEVASMQLQRERTAYDRIRDHRHVLKVYDIHLVALGGTELLILSMEHADGGNLRTWLEAHRDDHETRRAVGLEYFKQICLGLAACHDAGVVHLDMKPENALLVGDTFKVSDFNISMVVQNLTFARSSGSRASVAELDFGTPAYMAPEYWTAPHPDQLDLRTTIYSLGIILYEILHPRGNPPFLAGASRLRELHLHTPPPPLPEACEAEARVVTRCLEKDPARRYETIADLLCELEGQLVEAPGHSGEVDVSSEQAQAALEPVRSAMEERRFAEAERLCRAVAEQYPSYAEAKQLLDELQASDAEARRLYEGLAKQFETLSLSETGAILAEGSKAYPNHPLEAPLCARFEAKRDQYNKAVADAIIAARQDHWGVARTLSDTAKELDPKNPHAQAFARLVAELMQRLQKIELGFRALGGVHDYPKISELDQEYDGYTKAAKKQIALLEGGLKL